MKSWEYYSVGALFLLLTAIGKTLDKFRRKEIAGKIAVFSTLIFSVIGGLIAGAISTVYIETVQLQWVCIAGGSWMGEKILEVIAEAFEDKINAIFKNSKNEK